MPNTSEKPRSWRRLKVWTFSGLILVGLAFVFLDPIQSHLKVQSEVRKWRARIIHQKTSLPGGGEGIQRAAPSEASKVPTSIETPLTLSAVKSPWFMVADVTVQPGITLTLEPGTEIIIADQATLFVFGNLIAEGDASRPIRLHALSASNFWAGIFVGKGSAPSLLRHVEIANAHYGIRPVLSRVTLEDCVARNLRETCSALQSHTVFKNCRIHFEDFQLTGNINVFKFFKGTVLIENCDVYCPDTDLKIDAFDVDRVESGIFRGNRIHGSTCQGADGIDIGLGSRNVWIEGNLISDFVDKGISVGEGARAVITNNVIARCGMGVGVKDKAHAFITHTTFYGNAVGVDCYEKIPGQGGGRAEVRHSVFTGASNAPVQADALSTLTVSDSSCDTQVLPGNGNVRATPHFENPDLDLFNLVPDSASTNAGAAIAPPAASLQVKERGARIVKPGRKP